MLASFHFPFSEWAGDIMMTLEGCQENQEAAPVGLGARAFLHGPLGEPCAGRSDAQRRTKEMRSLLSQSTRGWGWGGVKNTGGSAPKGNSGEL